MLNVNRAPSQLNYQPRLPRQRSKLTQSSTWVTMLLVAFAAMALLMLIIAPLVFAISWTKGMR